MNKFWLIWPLGSFLKWPDKGNSSRPILLFKNLFYPLRFTAAIANVGSADFRPFIPKSSWEWHACHQVNDFKNVIPNPFFLRWTLKSTRWNKIKNIIILLNYTFASYRYHLFSINFLLLERKGKLHRKIESLLVVIFAGSANYLFSIYSFEHRLLCISSFWHFDVHHYNLKKHH